MNGRRVAADLAVVYRTYTRNPIALFFSLIFPIILIGLFGLIFSSIGTGATTLYVVNDDHASNASTAFLADLNQTTVVRVVTVNVSSSSFPTWLGQHDDPVGLVIPSGFQANYTANRSVTVLLYIDPQDAASTGAAQGAVSGVVNAFNLHAACPKGSNCTPLLSVQTATVGSPDFTTIDYLIPGLIGFSVLTSPMFSLVDISSSYRKEGIFRELSLTPLTRGEWLTSRIVWYVLLTFVSAAIVIGFGVLLFSAHVHLALGLLPFLVVGPFFFVSLGMLCGSAAKTPESAALIGNIVTFPMMFLSGTFFPVASFPSGLQLFAHLLPLYYVIDGMNQVMLFGNGALALTDFLTVLVASVVVFVLAVRLFRWRDE
jgi:ABC-2 type transport system permease protein